MRSFDFTVKFGDFSATESEVIANNEIAKAILGDMVGSYTSVNSCMIRKSSAEHLEKVIRERLCTVEFV